MKLAIETYVPAVKFGLEKSISMIKEAGFDAFDLSIIDNMKKLVADDDYLEKAKKLREYADSIGIVCNQAHAPWGFGGDDEMSMENENFRNTVRAIEFAAVVGAPNIIVHAVSRLSEGLVTCGERFYEYNRRFYKSLEPTAKRCDINISVENLYANSPDGTFIPVLGDGNEHREFVKSLESDCFNICVDLGHSYLTGKNPAEEIRKIGAEYLRALHVHDVTKTNDDHMLPYMCKLSWMEIISALSDIGYMGDFNFEVVGYLEKLHPEFMMTGLKYANDLGRFLMSKVK